MTQQYATMTQQYATALPARSVRVQELVYFLLGTSIPCAALGALSATIHLAGAISLAMLTPLISALAVQKFIVRKPILGPDGLGFRGGRLRWWGIALITFGALGAATIALSAALTPGLLASPAEFAENMSQLLLIPKSMDLMSQLSLAVAITLFVGVLLNLPLFLGEEVGWRGFMNPRLIALFGKPGVIFGGAIWAVWHLPFILLGHNYPDHPWLGLLLWVPICVCLNILLQAVYQRGRSIFPCALAHGAINEITPLLLMLFVRKDRWVDLLHGPAGLVGLLLLLLPALLVYRFGLEDGTETDA
jgi:membrane protease YdiL (CAAX protease family)